MKSLSSLALLLAALVSFLPAQTAQVTNLGGACGGPDPILEVTPPVPGNPLRVTVNTAFPHAHIFLVVSVGTPTPVQVPDLPCVVHVDVFNPNNFFVIVDDFTDAGGRFERIFSIPNDAAFQGLTLTLQARVWAEGGPIPGGDHLSNAVRLTFGNLDPCLLIIDEDGIDNGFSTIIAAAARLGVQADVLVNDNRPTEVGNPFLRWNEIGAGDIVVLPTGRVADEGFYALPPTTPFSLANFVAGTVPQNQLDNIARVQPLRNNELRALVGRTCVAVVYDSDISINVLPLTANLQGARLGRFVFTVLDVRLPGTIPESQSNQSLLDLVVRVESPRMGFSAYNVPFRDGPPDQIQLDMARWQNGTLRIVADSDFSPNAVMTVSVEGFITEARMNWNPSLGRYVLNIPATVNLDGRRVTLSTNEGGAYNDFIQ